MESEFKRVEHECGVCKQVKICNETGICVSSTDNATPDLFFYTCDDCRENPPNRSSCTDLVRQ